MSQPPQRTTPARQETTPAVGEKRSKPMKYGDTRRSDENNTHKGGATGTGGPGGTGGSVL